MDGVGIGAALFGTPLAHLLARRRFRGRGLLEVLVDLPTVLPPAVAGVALLLAFGRRGVVGQWLDRWWDEAARHVPLPAADVTAYRRALLERFANPRIRHTLAQIAADGSQKMPIRVLPVLRAERDAGRLPAGAVRVLAAWIDHLRGIGAPVNDAGAGPYRDRAGSVRDVLALLAPDLADDKVLIDAVGDAVHHA